MKTLCTCLALFFYVLCINGQTQTINCEFEIKKLNKAYENHLDFIKDNKEETSLVKKVINEQTVEELNKLIEERRKYQKALHKIYNKFTSFKDVCTSIPIDSIKEWFPHKKPLKLEEVKEIEKKKEKEEKKEEKKKDCESEIKKLIKTFEDYEKAKEAKEKEINEVKKVITSETFTKLGVLKEERNNIINSLGETYSKLEAYKIDCPSVTLENIKEWYKEEKPSVLAILFKGEENEPVTYSYFNENVIISEDINGKDTKQKKIFNQVLKQVNQETYLGDITIPKDGQEFCFYNNKFERQDEEKYTYKFKKIDIEVRDGSFADIQVLVEYKGSLLLFENYKGVSFLRYSHWARKNYLFYSQKQPTTNVDEAEFKDLRIRLSDVLMYKYKIGNNYIPYDLTLELPKEDIDGNETNLTTAATYQIKQDTYLDKIVELRAYTDFLALFGESDNGLVQLEGNAKFYMLPFSRSISNFPIFSRYISSIQFEYFKSITPYVHYAKFEEDKGLVAATGGVIGNTLDLVEKRFLTVGGEMNLFEIYQKSYPMRIGLFAAADYNLTRVQNDTQGVENIKAVSYGWGVNMSSKRFNNFGFNYKLGFHWFDYKNYNGSSTIDLDFKVPVVKNQAEVFYHPNKNPNQAIFARLVTYNYKGNTNDEAFYQFQFGYKFSIGSRTVKK
ncbi:hypothetical protein MHM83_14110 [Tenacibaculum sp. Mcav3-52]|uniref:hypothetical protein n=1 Tax=Tenacibaculum sp. Mcav3-52 TaxID=2917762 RepID=UPI001EF2DF65|nr:hypothetical protein [Tenacibaculum sp. Mcav3-52]MCG7503001.1 hypothetical protein [Tenacibaculum sp. Mcav3-52]